MPSSHTIQGQTLLELLRDCAALPGEARFTFCALFQPLAGVAQVCRSSRVQFFFHESALTPKAEPKPEKKMLSDGQRAAGLRGAWARFRCSAQSLTPCDSVRCIAEEPETKADSKAQSGLPPPVGRACLLTLISLADVRAMKKSEILHLLFQWYCTQGAASTEKCLNRRK